MSEAAQTSAVSSEVPKAFAAKAYAAASPTAPLAATSIQRRAPQPRDVQIEILYCGVCHSDLHQTRDEWHETMPTVYPCVPGHEIVGRVAKVGSGVKKFKEGDLVAVGCMVNSCGVCANCRAGQQQFCAKVPTFTYNSPEPILGGVTFGGYFRRALWWTKGSCCGFRTSWIRPRPRRCFARGSRRTRRCATGT